MWSRIPSVRADACASLDKGSEMTGLVGLVSSAKTLAAGIIWCSSSSRFGPTTSYIAAWPIQSGNQSRRDRVGSYREDDGGRCGCRFRSQCRSSTAGSGDHGHFLTNQIGCQFWQSIIAAIRPTILNGDVLTLDLTSSGQAFAESCNDGRRPIRRTHIKVSDHWGGRLLCMGGKRPSRRRTGNNFDEIAPSHCDPRGSGSWSEPQ